MERLFLTNSKEKRISRQPVAGADSRMSRILSLLEGGEVIACQPLSQGSNRVFLLSFLAERENVRAIYKPQRGEAPLYDFPTGTLYQREYAAYLVSQALGWFFVPPTVIRHGPFGIGSVQWFVVSKQASDYLTLRKDHAPELKRIAVFDWLVNNADRKRGHCLEGLDGRIWAIDHGLTFNVIPKLRTVIGDFSGQPIPEELLSDMRVLQRRLYPADLLVTELSRLLAPQEVEVLRRRLETILKNPILPEMGYWGLPWPPF